MWLYSIILLWKAWRNQSWLCNDLNICLVFNYISNILILALKYFIFSFCVMALSWQFNSCNSLPINNMNLCTKLTGKLHIDSLCCTKWEQQPWQVISFQKIKDCPINLWKEKIHSVEEDCLGHVLKCWKYVTWILIHWFSTTDVS